jgi:outer membrane cobalamin receptor
MWAQAALPGPVSPDGDNPNVVTVSGRAIPLSVAPASVTVLNRDYIEGSRAATATELLREVPFLYLSQNGAAGGLTTVTIRGGKPNFTLVMIDGIPVNDITNILGGSFDFSSLSTDNIEQVEIVRGPLSSLYGSDAVGGVINFISRRAVKSPALDGGAEAGNFGRAQGRLGSGGQWKSLGYSFSGSFVRVGDQVYQDSYSLGTVALHTALGLGPNRVLEFVARYQERRSAGLPSNGGGPEYSILRSPRDDRNVGLILGASYKAQFRPWWTWSIDLDRFSSDDNNFTPAILNRIPPDFKYSLPSSAGISRFSRVRAAATSAFIFSPRLSANVSVGLRDEDGHTHGFLNNTIPSSFQRQRRALVSSAELLYQTKSLTATVGLGFDRSEGYGLVVSPRIGVNYSVLGKGPRLKASWAKGFKLPSFYALSDPNIGNPRLQPERSRAFDVGVEQRFGSSGALVSVTYFRNNFTGLVDFSAQLFRLVNRSQASTQGVEFGGELPKMGPVRLGSSFSYVEWLLEGATEPLRDTPHWIGGAHANWSATKRIRARVEAQWVGRRYDYSVPRPDQPTAGGYSNSNGVVSYEYNDQVTFYVRADNLFNSRYHEYIGFPAPGISARLGVSFRSR